jgi:hypothetical protein
MNRSKAQEYIETIRLTPDEREMDITGITIKNPIQSDIFYFDTIMNEQRAKDIIENAQNSMEPSYFDLEQFDGRCCLDGMFTADELEAIAWCMRNKHNA